MKNATSCWKEGPRSQLLTWRNCSSAGDLCVCVCVCVCVYMSVHVSLFTIHVSHLFETTNEAHSLLYCNRNDAASVEDVLLLSRCYSECHQYRRAVHLLETHKVHRGFLFVLHTLTHVYIHVYIHTYVHTYIYTYIHVFISCLCTYVYYLHHSLHAKVCFYTNYTAQLCIVTAEECFHSFDLFHFPVDFGSI